MHTSRRTLLTGLAVTAPLALASCASGDAGTSNSDAGTAEDPIELILYNYNFGSAGIAGEGTQALLDRFAEAHPEITVVPVGMSSADSLSKTAADISAGSPPDVVQMGYSKADQAISTLPCMPLQDIAGDEWEAHVEGINAGLIETGTRDGKTYAMPYTVSIPTLFYNADLFAEAGLDADAPPTTSEEIRAAAEAISANGHQGVYFAVADVSKSDYLTQSVLNSAGAGTVDEDGAIAFDTPEAVEAFAYLQDLVTDSLMPGVSVDDAVASFSAGEMGMIIVTTAFSTSILAAAEGLFDLRSAGFPSINGGTPAPTHSGSGYMVFSEDPAKQKAAWEFLKFCTDEAGYTMITELLGYLPLRESVVDHPDYLQGYFEEDTLLIPPTESLSNVEGYRTFPVEDTFQATTVFQTDGLEPIVLRGADIESSLASVREQIEGMPA